MMKANFIRKPTYEELIPQYEFIIKKVITLSNKEFDTFIHYPLDDYDFIEQNKELMFVSNDDISHCILVKSETSNFGILVESEGFSYARYASYIPLCMIEEGN